MGRNSSIVLIMLVVALALSNAWTYFQGISTSTTLKAIFDENISLTENHNTLLTDYQNLTTAYRTLCNDHTLLNETYIDLQNSHNSLEMNYSALMDDYDSVMENLTKALLEIEHLTSMYNFTHFSNMSSLNTWLSQDTTDQNTYVPVSYDCDDFALSLMLAAFKSNYQITTISVYCSDELLHVNQTEGTYWLVPKSWSIVLPSDAGYHLFANHVANLAYVQEIGWVLIEPQTDEVYPLGTHEL
jgi:hypothetical protein